MSSNAANAGISRADVEKALWELTGWHGDQVVIDGVLLVMDAWIATSAEALANSPASFREGYYHALVTAAEAILDTGGRLRLSVPETEPVLRAGAVDDLAARLAERVNNWDDGMLDALAARILEKLPEAARREEDRRTLADPLLQESLTQLRDQDLFPAVRPAKAEVKAPEYNDDGELMIQCLSCTSKAGHDVFYPASNFWKDAKNATGYKTKCRDCARAAKGKNAA
jgi:hypothetical protein